jgi:tRNA(fMet)-specific endonuclease VapC
LSPRYLLDTNVLSEPVKAQPNPGVMRRLQAHRQEIATGSPAWHELLYGCHRMQESKRRRLVEEYLYEALAPSLNVLPYDAVAAEIHGRERARLSQLGKSPAFIDGQLAAIARAHHLVLVTRNTDDFRHFAELELEDWHEA